MKINNLTSEFKLIGIYSCSESDKKSEVIFKEGLAGFVISVVPLTGGGLLSAHSILTADSKVGSALTLNGLAIAVIGLYEENAEVTRVGIITSILGLGILIFDNSLAKTALLVSGIGITALGLSFALSNMSVNMKMHI